jgi:hypothetical protein
MASFRIIACALFFAGLSLAGCSRQSAGLDGAAFEKSFGSAEPSLKSAADQVVSALKSSDYENALLKLNQVMQNGKLSPEQLQKSNDLRSRLWKLLADHPPKSLANPSAAAPN